MYKRAKLGIGYLAQEASVFRKLSVEENILAVLEMTTLTKAQQKEKMESLLEEFSLTHVRKTSVWCFLAVSVDVLKLPERWLWILNLCFWTSLLRVLIL